MQLVALGEGGEYIYADSAEKGVDYCCIECGAAVRRRGGDYRRDHFYHLVSTGSCRSSGKGVVHLQVQLSIFSLLSGEEVVLEKKFYEINRVADICWEREKIVFEVQCSAITSKEVLERNRDYRSLGYEVVWILHDRRYNRKRVSSVEELLKDSPHYYTDIDREGAGVIYDQLSTVINGVRRRSSIPKKIALSTVMRSMPPPLNNRSLIAKRIAEWNCYFSGDLIDQYGQGIVESWLVEEVARGRKEWIAASISSLFSLYKRYFRLFLEKMCQ